MALFKPLYGNKSRLSFDITPFHEGYVYLCDDGSLYCDMYVGDTQKRIPIKADAEAVKNLIELNKALNVSIWVGTKAEFDAITDKDANCLYITTDDTENIQWEMLSNKVTELTDGVTDEQYPSAKAVWSLLSNLSQYEKTENKLASFTEVQEPTADQYFSAAAIVELATDIDNEFVRQSRHIAACEQSANKVADINSTNTDTQYPSAKAVYDAIVSQTSNVVATNQDTTMQAKLIAQNNTDFSVAQVRNVKIMESEPSLTDLEDGEIVFVI